MMKNKTIFLALFLTVLLHVLLIVALSSSEELKGFFSDKNGDCVPRAVQAVTVSESAVLEELEKINNEEKYYTEKNAQMQTQLDELQQQHRQELAQQKVRLQHQTDQANETLQAIVKEKQQQQKVIEQKQQQEQQQQEKLAKLQQDIQEYERLKKARSSELKQLNQQAQDLKNAKNIEQKRLNDLKQQQQALDKKQRREQQQKQQQAEQQRIAKQREAEKQRQIAERKKQAEAQKRLAAEKQRRLEAERQAEIKAQYEAELAAEQKEMQRLQNQEKRVFEENAVNKAKAQIQAKIQRKWLRPEGLPSGLYCTLEIRTAPSGDVIKARVIKSSGNIAFDRSAEGAVYDASPLPVPTDKNLFNGIYADGTKFDGFRLSKIVFDPERITTSR